jgi:hypothetical protein
LDPTFDDYVECVGEVVRRLAETEERTSDAVLADLLSARFDQLRWPLHAVDGRVRLADMALAATQLRDLFDAAARAAEEPRRVYGKRSDQVAHYIDSLQMPHTEQGSFVVSVLSPLPPLLQSTLDGMPPDLVEDPFERQVMKKLSSALVALPDAADAAGRDCALQPIEDAVQFGVSASMCEVVSAMMELQPNEDLRLQFNWSPSRPEPRGSQAVVVPRVHAIVLREAARQFRDRAPRSDYVLEGFVIQLDREGADPGADPGEVTIKGVVEGRLRPVRVKLDAPAYLRAIDAHKEVSEVSVGGTLVKDGRGLRLKDPDGFTVRPAT